MDTTELIGTQRDASHDQLVDPMSAAELLGVTEGTLSVWRCTGRYNLPFVKVGAKVRYRRSDLLEWLKRRTRQAGATA